MSQSKEQSPEWMDQRPSPDASSASGAPAAATQEGVADMPPESIRNVAGGVYNVEADRVAASVAQQALSRDDEENPARDEPQPADPVGPEAP